jgi:hypothetical protein
MARLAGVLGLVLITATAMVWLLFWLRPPGPACLILVGAGYEDNLAVPPNAQGRETMSRFARLAGSSSPLSRLFQRSGRLRLAHSPTEMRRGTDWARGVDDAREKTIIVFLALHGGADGKGAYLLPHDTSADPEDRLRLDAVLDRLAQLPDDRNKLLILDATGLGAHWTMGLLHNDFPRALAELESRIITIPNLVVLSASGIDQRSWPSADLRTSLFGHYLLEGLLGQAGQGSGLDAWKLYQHVAGKVEQEARQLHGVVQTPVLLPREGGEARARAISLTFRLDESALEGDPIGDALTEIEPAWAHYDAFRARAPAAQACVPRDWQLWEAWLVRHQQLRLAGSPFANKARDNATEAETRVRHGLDLQLLSVSSTLAMPAVQGEANLYIADPYPPMEELWQASAADRRTVWQGLQKRYVDPLLRRNMLFALIRRAAENPARNLDRAADLALLLDDPVRVVRPAEAHFLVLLRRDLAVRPIPDELNSALRDALRLRLFAEQTALVVETNGYAYAERIRPWISRTIEEADLIRQQGQDLLFGTERSQSQQAQELSGKATTLYQQARNDSLGLRDALAICDRAVAQLPLLSSWLASFEGDSNGSLLTSTFGLFDDVRQLEQMVMEVLARHDPAKIATIREKTKAAQEGLNRLQVRLDEHARTCESTQWSPLRDGGPLLEVPWLEPGLRRALLHKLGRLAQRARSEREADVAVSPAQLDDQMRLRGVRTGRLALAALGPRWFDQTRGMPYGDVEPFVRRPDLEGVWSKVLRWAGDQIGERFRRYPMRVEELLREARKKPDVGTPLREADRLARRLDAGQWQAANSDAPVFARRADIQTLLVWQATRTWTDHWYGEDQRSVPYYRIIGLDYLRDARRLDPFGRADSPGAEVVRKQLEASAAITIASARGDRHMIAGDRLVVDASLSAPRGISVTGYPLLWADLEHKLTFGRLQDAGRAVVKAGTGTDVEQLAVTLTCPELMRAEESPPADASAEQSAVVWRGYYRGQKPAATTPILLHPVAESTRIDYPPPPRAGIALKADESLFLRYGRARGGLVLIVDCSGSLGPPRGESSERQTLGEARTRFRQSVQALRTILARVPRGTRLSLWTFGQAMPPRNSVDRAEDTIQRLRDPEIWNGGEREIEALVSQVEALEPWNESPVATAILRARADLLKVEGFRQMIVLSDGDDNRFAKDASANPDKEPISEVLRRRLAGSNIGLHLVGFSGKDGQAEPELSSNFGFVTSRTPKGTLSTVTRLQALLDAMSQTMHPGLRYRLVSAGLDQSGSDEVEISYPRENDRWLMVRGSHDGYRLQVPQLEFDRRITLDEGDFVLVQLDQSEQRWRRLIWSREPAFARRPARETGGWRAAVLQNQLLGQRSLQMLLSIEKESPRSNDPGQVRPGALWLEVAATGSKAVPAIRWGALAGFPAPAWGIDASGWPQGPPAPSLRAWWGELSRTSALLVRRTQDFDMPGDLKGTRSIGKEAILIERVTVEEHWVQTQPDRREKRWCVVVGVTGKPLWAQLEGVRGLAGQEHRQFESAQRYVGLWWFADATSEEEVRRKLMRELTGIRFVSVTGFKEEMAARAQSSSFTDLDTPAALPVRPRPVAGP